MPTDLVPPLALLLHEGGWDEILMVGIALGIAYLVIVWTGRRNEDEEDELEDEDGSASDPPEAKSDQKPGQRS
jgi:hypothetical protein